MNDSVNNATITLSDNEVTLAKLASAVAEKLLPAGAVQAFAMNASPTGWLACNGSEISRTTYADLFTAISTNYGAGDGSTTFNIPDLRGYFLRGAGTNSDGTAAGAFGTRVADLLKDHQHVYLLPGSTNSGYTGGNAINAGANGTTNTSTVNGGLGGAETRPKNIAMLYCIKF